MSKLFEDDNSDSGEELKINDGYANNYNNWRQKEELNKLKTKYGEHIEDLASSNDESESSSEDDEDANELTEEFEKDFYKTLACLKKKDPSIYNQNTKFFTATPEVLEKSKKSAKKEKPLSLRDYERKIVLEKGGQLSDSENEDDFRKKTNTTNTLTYVEEQKKIKESIAKALDDDEEDDLLQPKQKSESEKKKEEEAFKEWLKGQPKEIDESAQATLKPLRDFWSDPNLDPNEKFLRDYILNKKFLEDDSGNHERLHDSDADLDEDKKNIEKQEEFEHKYNFRFEEPDQEFIKRYPRTMEDSIRKKDTRRAQKRAEVKKRKEEEKLKKQEELKQLKALKRKEIADKIAQLKEITGNEDMKFDDIDLEGDFDPEEHDKKMQQMFNDQYYAEGDEPVKPEFPDIDEELGIEDTWDNYDPNAEEIEGDHCDNGEQHCEDPEFNMDADYDPTKVLEDEMIGASKKKKRRRRSRFAEMISKDKPKFDPAVHASYKDYIDQYYALDYEDMIGDLPCRFKYRNVVPNDYGLSVEEILMADDKELNKWCSLKKALEHKPEHLEQKEVKIYQQKASNENYKRKVLQSLYKPLEEENPAPITNGVDEEDSASKKKRRRKKKKSGEASTSMSTDDKQETPAEVEQVEKNSKKKRKADKVESAESNGIEEPIKKKIKNDTAVETEKEEIVSKAEETSGKDNDGSSNEMKKKKKNKKKNSEKLNDGDNEQSNTNGVATDKNNKKFSNNETIKNKKKKKIASDAQQTPDASGTSESSKTKQQLRKEKFKKLQKNKKLQETQGPLAALSDERLKAYGIKPKVFKQKLKYGKSK